MITDKATIQNYMLVDIDSSFDSQLDDWIKAVENYINKTTNRQIIADASPSTWKYDGTGTYSLNVEDFLSITQVQDTFEGNTTDITDKCFFYPANTTPKWRIEAIQRFIRGHQNVLVTGTRGFATQADIDSKYTDLKLAASVLVAGIINYAYGGDKEVASETIGRYSVSYSTDKGREDFVKALDTIKQYRRVR